MGMTCPVVEQIQVIDELVYIWGICNGSATLGLWRLDKYGYKAKEIEEIFSIFPYFGAKAVVVPTELYSHLSCG